MRKLGFILLIYYFVGLYLVYFTDWIYEVVTIDMGFFGKHTTERCNIFNYIDTPFYIAGAIYYFLFRNRLSVVQNDAYVMTGLFLALRYVEQKLIGTSFQFTPYLFVMWNCVITLSYIIYRFNKGYKNY